MNKKVIIESVIKEDALGNLMPFLECNLSVVREFDGCLGVRVFLDKESRKMIFDEEWTSVEQHQEYLRFIAGNGVMENLVSFLESSPKIKYFDRLEI
ncbi:MAG: hypothetical protein ABW158_04275 [Candidatus Thiodiazotropha sp. 6PDIVS]